MGTYSVSATGQWQEAERAVVFKGSGYDPLMKAGQDFRVILRFQDTDRITLAWEMHFPGMDPYVMVTTEYRRKRDPAAASESPGS